MLISPYQISYWNGSSLSPAEVRPCCREDNIVDYAIYFNNQLAFNITKLTDGSVKWVISLKNADDEFDDKVIQSIGSEIDQYNTNKNLWK